jgi:hypothetical protein
VPLFGDKLFDPKKVRESVPIVEQLQALKKVVDQGKVRYMEGPACDCDSVVLLRGAYLYRRLGATEGLELSLPKA